MILGTGVDIVSTDRLCALIEKCGQVFLDRTFTAREREAASLRPDPSVYYSTRFAAKEAVFKSLRPPDDSGCDPREVEVLNDPTGFPYAVLRGRLRELAAERRVSAIHVSVSDEDDYVIAFATSESRDRKGSMHWPRLEIKGCPDRLAGVLLERFLA